MQSIHSKTYTKWSDRLRSDKVWTETEIRYLRKALGQSGIRDRAERASLLFEFQQVVPKEGFRITRAQSRKGTEYLRTKSLRANGIPRISSKLGQRELSILQTAVEHRLVDLYPSKDWNGGIQHLLPVYRCIGRDGSAFDYLGTTYDQLQVIR